MMKIDTSTALGALIRRERKAQHLTQVELAALIGVGIRFLRELELGKENCRIGLTFQVLAALGLSIDIKNRTKTTAETSP